MGNKPKKKQDSLRSHRKNESQKQSKAGETGGQSNPCTVYVQTVTVHNKEKTDYINLLCQYYYAGVEGIQDWLKEKTNNIVDSKKVELPVRLSKQEQKGWILCNKKKGLYFLPIPSYEELKKTPPREASSEEAQFTEGFDIVLSYLRTLDSGVGKARKLTKPGKRETEGKENISILEGMKKEGESVPGSEDVSESIHDDVASPELSNAHGGEGERFLSVPVQPSRSVEAMEADESPELPVVIERVLQLKEKTNGLWKQVGEQGKTIESLKKSERARLDEVKKYQQKIQEQEEENGKLKNSLQQCEKKRDTYKADLEHAQENHKRYVACLKCYDDNVKAWAKSACQMFAYLDRMEQGSDQLYQQQRNVPSIDLDAMNHYMLRIQSKYAVVKNSISNLFQIRQELSSLAELGMLPKQGVLYPQLKEIADPQRQEEQLRYYIHKSVAGPLMGAAIIRCDEYAYFLPCFVNNIPREFCKFFAELSGTIRTLLKGLHYEVVYAAPFKHINEFNHVKNVEAAPSGLEKPSGTIFEVRKMAVNYGNQKEETEVSAVL